MSDDYDSPWKEALDRYLPDFMALLFPAIHADIDWTQGYESLDKELQQVTRDAQTGRREVDKLVKIRRQGSDLDSDAGSDLDSGRLGERDGRPRDPDGEEEQWVLIHIEVQGGWESTFSERMFTYHYRLYDRYRRPLASLGVLTDDNPKWRPNRFGYSVWGTRIALDYPIVKLRDYQDRWEELQASRNPFAVVVQAQLKTVATRKSPDERYHWKWLLVRSLYERGFGKRDILELFRFIDWLLVLPDAASRRFQIELAAYEEEKHMPYITSVERIGIEKGILQGVQQGIQQGVQQGIQQGEALVIKRLLARRFGPLPDWVEERLAQAAPPQLEEWAERVLDAGSLDDMFGE